MPESRVRRLRWKAHVVGPTSHSPVENLERICQLLECRSCFMDSHGFIVCVVVISFRRDLSNRIHLHRYNKFVVMTMILHVVKSIRNILNTYRHPQRLVPSPRVRVGDRRSHSWQSMRCP